MKKRISRNDVIFLAILLAVVTVFLVVYERTGTRADAGACVRVTVDGSVYGIYALGEEQEIPIVQDGVTTNVLTIRDGRGYNIGNSQPVRLMDFIQAIESACGKEAMKDFLPMQPGDVYQTNADTTLLQQAVGFKPSMDIQEGVNRTVAWFKSYYNL